MLFLNPLVPAQEKFARFRSVQKCTFFAFYGLKGSSTIFDNIVPTLEKNFIFDFVMNFEYYLNRAFKKYGRTFLTPEHRSSKRSLHNGKRSIRKFLHQKSGLEIEKKWTYGKFIDQKYIFFRLWIDFDCH